MKSTVTLHDIHGGPDVTLPFDPDSGISPGDKVDLVMVPVAIPNYYAQWFSKVEQSLKNPVMLISNGVRYAQDKDVIRYYIRLQDDTGRKFGRILDYPADSDPQFQIGKFYRIISKVNGVDIIPTDGIYEYPHGFQTPYPNDLSRLQYDPYFSVQKPPELFLDNAEFRVTEMEGMNRAPGRTIIEYRIHCSQKFNDIGIESHFIARYFKGELPHLEKNTVYILMPDGNLKPKDALSDFPIDLEGGGLWGGFGEEYKCPASPKLLV